MRSRKAHSCRAGAIMALEFLFLFPLMLAIFFGTVEYALLLAAEARLYNASREGARVAAAGGNLDDVKAAAKTQLLLTEQTIVQIDAFITDPPASSNPVLPGGQVAVMVSAPAGMLVPDYLRFIGISICNKCLIGQTVMRKE